MFQHYQKEDFFDEMFTGSNGSVFGHYQNLQTRFETLSVEELEKKQRRATAREGSGRAWAAPKPIGPRSPECAEPSTDSNPPAYGPLSAPNLPAARDDEFSRT